MSDKRNRDAERRAEVAFAMQQDLIRQQQRFLTQRNAESQKVISLLELAEAGNREAQELALGDLNRAISGEASPALQAFLNEEQLRAEEIIRRNLGVGGETSSPGIDIQEQSTLARAKAIEQARQGDIGAAVQATSGVGNLEDARVGRLLQTIDNPLEGSQVLGQSIANLGKLSQYNVPQDSFWGNVGAATIAGLTQSPNAFSNIKSNVSGINQFLRGKGVPYVPFI
jgi:hypothetical protein